MREWGATYILFSTFYNVNFTHIPTKIYFKITTETTIDMYIYIYIYISRYIVYNLILKHDIWRFYFF